MSLVALDSHHSPVCLQLRAEFPNAEVVASTYDAFATALQSVRSTLPVINAEIGDTWIYGGTPAFRDTPVFLFAELFLVALDSVCL